MLSPEKTLMVQHVVGRMILNEGEFMTMNTVYIRKFMTAERLMIRFMVNHDAKDILRHILTNAVCFCSSGAGQKPLPLPQI